MTTPVVVRQPIPNAIQMTLRLVQGSQTAAVVLGAKSVGGAALTQADATSWCDGTWAAFRPYVTSNVSCVGAQVRFATPDSAVFDASAPPSPAGGNVNGQALAAACWLLKWKSVQGGRSGKGRTFLPGLPSSQVSSDGRTYDSTAPANAQAMINAYLGQALFTGTVWKPAVLSFTKGAAYDIESGSLATIVGVQRRRMRP